MSSLSEVNGELKEIVLARLKCLNGTSKIMLLGENNTLTVKDLMHEVEVESDLGKKIIEVHLKYMQMLFNGEI